MSGRPRAVARVLRRRLDVLDVLGLVVLVGGLLALQGAGPPAGSPVACPLHALTGLDCPGCGSLRACHDLLSGDVLAALDHNAVFVAVLPVALTMWAFRLVRGGDGSAARATSRLPLWAPRASLVALGLWMLARNLPVTPLTALAA